MTPSCRAIEHEATDVLPMPSRDQREENLETESKQIRSQNSGDFEPMEQERKSVRDNVVELPIRSCCTQIGRDNTICFDSKIRNNAAIHDSFLKEGPVLRFHRKPDDFVAIGRSRLGFPDWKNDHLIQLLVCKGPSISETVDITDKYDITVSVKYDGTMDTGQDSPEYQCKLRKNEMRNGNLCCLPGLVDFLFRFHEPNVKYKITFALKMVPPKNKRRKKSGASHINSETISEVSLVLETGCVETKPNKTKMKMSKNRVEKSGKAVVTLRALGAASQSEECLVLVKRSSWVMKQLQSLRDNGKWEDFSQVSTGLLHSFPDIDTQIAVKLEESVAACYRNDLERSIQLINEADGMISQAKNPCLLAGRSRCYLAGVLRRQRKLGEAEQCVELAEQNLRCCQSNLDESYVVYEKASVLLDFIARAPQRSYTQIREALKTLEKCVDVCVRIETEYEELYLKKHHFAFIKMALLLLDCRTEAARKRIVSGDFIAKGRRCLNTLQIKYWDEISEGVKIQFYLARSDLEYRESNFAEAEKFALMAKEMATSLGFGTEISPAQERVDHITQLQASSTHHKEAHVPSDAGNNETKLFTSGASEGKRDDVIASSSGPESDWWLFQSGNENQ